MHPVRGTKVYGCLWICRRVCVCACVWGRERVVIVGERERMASLDDETHLMTFLIRSPPKATTPWEPGDLEAQITCANEASDDWVLTRFLLSLIETENLGNYPPPHSHLIKPLSKSYIRRMDGWGACSVCSLADKDCMLMEGKEKKTLARCYLFVFLVISFHGIYPVCVGSKGKDVFLAANAIQLALL